MKSGKSMFNTMLTFIFTLSLVVVIGVNFYHYIYLKKYDVLVEVPCDSSFENCFSRDCSNPDDCPPNRLSVYKKYAVKGYDFLKCNNNSCEEECETESIKCSIIICREAGGDSCKFLK